MRRPFFWVQCSDDSIAKAKAWREDTDRIRTNSYPVIGTDSRWTGDLGEMEMNAQLRAHLGPSAFMWHFEIRVGCPDFDIYRAGGRVERLDVKTTSRNGPPRPFYNASVTKAALERHEWESFFFLSYDTTTGRMYFCGGISRADFMARMREVPVGGNFNLSGPPLINTKATTYVVPLSALTPWEEWIAKRKPAQQSLDLLW